MLCRTIRSWNCLPYEIIISVTLNSFKSAMGYHLRAEWFVLVLTNERFQHNLNSGLASASNTLSLMARRSGYPGIQVTARYRINKSGVQEWPIRTQWNLNNDITATQHGYEYMLTCRIKWSAFGYCSSDKPIRGPICGQQPSVRADG